MMPGLYQPNAAFAGFADIAAFFAPTFFATGKAELHLLSVLLGGNNGLPAARYIPPIYAGYTPDPVAGSGVVENGISGSYPFDGVAVVGTNGFLAPSSGPPFLATGWALYTNFSGGGMAPVTGADFPVPILMPVGSGRWYLRGVVLGFEGNSYFESLGQ
jgi:hypothetical protein